MMRTVELAIFVYADGTAIFWTEKKSVHKVAKVTNLFLQATGVHDEKVLRSLARGMATRPEINEIFQWQATP